MKSTLIVFALSIAAVAPFPSKAGYDENGWTMIPDSDGHLHLMNIKQLEYEASQLGSSEVVTKFILHTRTFYTGQEIFLNDVDSLRKSNFNVNHPTRFIVHGWINHEDSNINVVIRQAYLEHGEVNVIVVDWSHGSLTINYIAAKNKVEEVGKQVAEAMDFLNEQGASFSDMYCIGHSLGAHVCGHAGKNTKRGRIDTIFGLDTALPLFDINNPKQRLSDDDAVYVQCMHTDGGRLGFDRPIGKASFYPAWGGVQDGCILDVTGACSHNRAYSYFAESIKPNNGFIGEKCGDIKNIEKKKCQQLDSKAPMGGEPSNHGITGIYYVPINSKSPFAKGF